MSCYFLKMQRFLSILLLFVPLISQATPLLPRLDAFAKGPGLAFIVMKEGKIIRQGAYGFSDISILNLLKEKSRENIPIKLEFDPTASLDLKKILPTSIASTPVKCKGLMHRKIVVIDHHQVFLGSANFTTASLRHHSNLVIGIDNKNLANFLESPATTSYSFEIQNQRAHLFLLPDPTNQGFDELLSYIQAAEQKICIAMFTLTHPQIVDALIQAQKRGVKVLIALDYYTAKGASKKALKKLEQAGIKIYLSQGRELLHHKWAFIDDTSLIMGSANWTKSAFTKNHDFLLFLPQLPKVHKKFLIKLWKIIEVESTASIETYQAA